MQSSSTLVTAGDSATISASCPAGIATGGGYQSTGALDVTEDAPIGGSPTSGPTGWQLSVTNTDGTDQNVTVYAVCGS
jgi:hypothetical protein